MSKKRISIKNIFKRKRFWLAIFYISLLIWSGIYRNNIPQKPIPINKKSVQLNAFDGNKKLEREIIFAYKDLHPKPQNDILPVILIHGSPGSAEVFDGLSELIKDRRLISIDLPGFGNSEQNIPDYSIYAHANYLEDFLNKLNIEKAHFVGFSLGGGVILQFEEIAPNRVESISFISSIGVQEYELFGDYHINHFIHGVQLAFCWALQELMPHFGIFDGVPMSYSRNFFDTDQRPLRKILQKTNKPFQIIHGKNDPLVPIEAAREHKRIVPQSEFHELVDTHFFIFQNPEKVNRLLADFWETVENKTAKTRSNADKTRIDEANRPFEFNVLKATGATLFVCFLILAINAFFNEDLTFLLAGLFIAQGRVSFTFAIMACLFTITISIIFWFLLGKYRNKKTAIFDRHQSSNIFTTRNYGFRFPMYFAFGKFNVGFWKFLWKFILSTIIWTLSLIFASYMLANVLVSFLIVNSQNTFGLVSLIVVFYLLISFFIKRFSK